MESNGTFGGWTRPQIGTGVPTPTIVVKAVISLAIAHMLTIQATGGHLEWNAISRRLNSPSVFDAADLPLSRRRTPVENLRKIKEVLTPAISDLANALGVTRQSIYNWMNGAQVSPENSARLNDLASAAEILVESGVRVNPTVLSRKIADGRNLFQVVQNGDSAKDFALVLVPALRRESDQRAILEARFAKRSKTPATPDFDLPTASDPIEEG